MFFVHFKNDTILTEQQLGKWTKVPVDAEIKMVGILIPIQHNGRSGFLSLSPLPEHCDKYCCTNLGRAIVGKDHGNMVGHALMGIKGGLLYRVEMTAKGLGPMKIIPADQFKFRESAWRNGC